MKKKGQEIAEWGLILAVLAVISMLTWQTLGDRLKETGSNVSFLLNQANQYSSSAATTT